MKLLYISDKFDYSEHNFIDSFIKYYLPYYGMKVDIIYWSKRNKDTFLLPYKAKIENYINLKQYDYVIVRNFFWALKNILIYRRKYNYKVGFQLSFPHTFRRVYEAKNYKKNVIRKTIEYKIKTFLEKNLIYKTDFFMPISNEMIKIFYSDINIPYFVTPLGIDERYVKQPIMKKDGIYRLIYIGTIDKLRKFDNVLNHLSKYYNKRWQLDIYSKNKLKIPYNIKNKVFFKNYIPRNKIINVISNYDIGIFLLPETKLYTVASPTKVMEYYQAGIPAIMSNIPECVNLFDNNSGIIQNFDNLNFKEVFNKSKNELFKMAVNGQKILLQKRNYKLMAQDFKNFLKGLN